MSERLSAFESQTSTGLVNSDGKQPSLAADSLVTLLTQGLQSSDATLLDVSFPSCDCYYIKQYQQQQKKEEEEAEERIDRSFMERMPFKDYLEYLELSLSKVDLVYLYVERDYLRLVLIRTRRLMERSSQILCHLDFSDS